MPGEEKILPKDCNTNCCLNVSLPISPALTGFTIFSKLCSAVSVSFFSYKMANLIKTTPNSYSGCETNELRPIKCLMQCLAYCKVLQMFPLMTLMTGIVAIGVSPTVAGLPVLFYGKPCPLLHVEGSSIKQSLRKEGSEI